MLSALHCLPESATLTKDKQKLNYNRQVDISTQLHIEWKINID